MAHVILARAVDRFGGKNYQELIGLACGTKVQVILLTTLLTTGMSSEFLNHRHDSKSIFIFNTFSRLVLVVVDCILLSPITVIPPALTF